LENIFRLVECPKMENEKLKSTEYKNMSYFHVNSLVAKRYTN